MLSDDGSFTREVKARMFARARGRCEICGVKTDDGHFHHRKPRRMGGTSDVSLGTPANGLYLHFRCHERVESNRASSYLMGYLVAAVDDPLMVPVRLWDGWWRLDVDGSLVPSPGKVDGVA